MILSKKDNETLFGILVFFILLMVFLVASDSQKKQEVAVANSDEINIFVDQTTKDYVFGVLSSISSGDIEGKTDKSDPIEFRKFFTEKKDVIRSIGITESKLKKAFRACVLYVALDEEDDLDFFEMENFKFMIYNLGEEVPIFETGEAVFGELLERFDDTGKRMVFGFYES